MVNCNKPTHYPYLKIHLKSAVLSGFPKSVTLQTDSSAQHSQVRTHWGNRQGTAYSNWQPTTYCTYSTYLATHRTTIISSGCTDGATYHAWPMVNLWNRSMSRTLWVDTQPQRSLNVATMMHTCGSSIHVHVKCHPNKYHKHTHTHTLTPHACTHTHAHTHTHTCTHARSHKDERMHGNGHGLYYVHTHCTCLYGRAKMSTYPTCDTTHLKRSGRWLAQAQTRRPPLDPPIMASLCT